MFYMIQGFFFSLVGVHSGDLLADEPSEPTAEGYYFGGVFCFPEVEDYQGGMFDEVGQSEMRNIQLTETTLTFDKVYIWQQHSVHYSLDKQANGTWLGKWQIGTVAGGIARAYLTAIVEDFVAPPTDPNVVWDVSLSD